MRCALGLCVGVYGAPQGLGCVIGVSARIEHAGIVRQALETCGVGYVVCDANAMLQQ